MSLPVILLVFANDLENPERYLKELDGEQVDLINLLRPFFRVEACPHAVPQHIEKVFHIFGETVGIFHFAGHAGPNAIQLAEGKLAYVQGLAPLVAMQGGVKLVFLNGCSTFGQIEAYRKANVPAVIATDKPINDNFAREFASLFYANFVESKQGLSLSRSFEATRYQIELRYPSPSAYYSRGFKPKKEEYGDNFPYILYLKDPAAGELCYADFTEETNLGGEKSEDLVPEKKRFVPPEAHLLCNRETVNQDFEDSVGDCLKTEFRKPMVYLVHGLQKELPLDLCRRFYHFSVAKTFNRLDKVLEASRFERFEIEMPGRRDFEKGKELTRIKENLKFALHMDYPAKQIDQLSALDILKHLGTHAKIALFEHSIYEEKWPKEKQRSFLKSYLGEFWQVELPEESPEILILFSFQYQGRVKKSAFRLRRSAVPSAIHKEFEPYVCSNLDQLMQVKRIEVKEWNDKYAKDDPGLTDRIFGEEIELPMQEIHPHIRGAVIRARR